MAGKRLSPAGQARAIEGPLEDRALRPSEDRGRRRRKLRVGRRDGDGLTERDRDRLRAFEGEP